MKTIILVRHAKTEQLVDFSQSDFNRKLLPRGREDSLLVVEQLKGKGYRPDVFITSKAKRAKQTCDIFAKELNYDSSIIEEQFLYEGYTTATLINYIGNLSESKECVIIFGHNPDIAGITVNLAKDELFHFPTGVVTAIKFAVDKWSEIETRSGMVELYIYPNMFR